MRLSAQKLPYINLRLQLAENKIGSPTAPVPEEKLDLNCFPLPPFWTIIFQQTGERIAMNIRYVDGKVAGQLNQNTLFIKATKFGE